MGVMEETHSRAPGGDTGSSKPMDTEVQMASLMAEYMLGHPKMAGAYEKAAGNPAGLGLLAAQTILGVRDKLIEKDLLTNDEIWAADDGVLPRTVDYIKGVIGSMGYDVTDEDSQAIYQSAIQTLSKFDEAGEASKKKTGAPTQQPQGAAGLAAQGPQQSPPPPVPRQ
jgi:hypothetical protein